MSVGLFSNAKTMGECGGVFCLQSQYIVFGAAFNLDIAAFFIYIAVFGAFAHCIHVLFNIVVRSSAIMKGVIRQLAIFHDNIL
jgi:hypothetical protein